MYQKTIQTLMAKLSSVGLEHEAELSRRDLQQEDAERDRSDGLVRSPMHIPTALNACHRPTRLCLRP